MQRYDTEHLKPVTLHPVSDAEEAWDILQYWSDCGVKLFTLAKGPGGMRELQFTIYASGTDDSRLKKVGGAFDYLLAHLDDPAYGGKRYAQGARHSCSTLDGYLIYACRDQHGDGGRVQGLVNTMRAYGIPVREEEVGGGVGGTGAADIPFFRQEEGEGQFNPFQQLIRKLLKELKEKGIELTDAQIERLVGMVAKALENYSQMHLTRISPEQYVRESTAIKNVFAYGQQALEPGFRAPTKSGPSFGM